MYQQAHASRVPFYETTEIKMYVNVKGEQKRATPQHREEIFSALYDEPGSLQLPASGVVQASCSEPRSR